MRARLSTLALWLALVVALAGFPRAALAVRHHSYVGTITRISATALTIHSKTHAANFTFVIEGSTRFLQHGAPIPSARFRVGSYVTVSYSPGPHG
ncbi:MAG TPA: hypothetical protein VHB98_17055, partial [Chloroflexota bacterium]|nr:hypothetical protein [Chloroflexota bacterium]